MVRVGTSGYSYDDWVGTFYPQGTPKGDFLRLYAQRFNTVEINMTFYRIPDSGLVASWARRTPADFDFVVKANRLMTHEPANPESEDAFNSFREAVRPLADAGKLGALLAQFPYGFKCTRDNVAYLRQFRERVGDIPLVLEFRNSGWAHRGTFDLLRQLGAGFCCVDEPRLKGLMPPLAQVTSDIAYLRFHGRNAAKWWNHQEAYERYDYLYSEAELREWVGKVRDMSAQAQRVYVYFNNHFMGKAPANASLFKELLEAEEVF